MTMQCVAHEEKFKIYYHETHRYSVKDFERHISEYIALHPLPSTETGKITEDKETKKMWRPKRDSLETLEKHVLIKSGGLYRNHNSPENKKVQNKATYKDMLAKKPKKKSDEPIVWVLDNNNK